MNRTDSESGQIGLLVVGLCVLALSLVVGVINVTAVQLSKARLHDLCDAAALDAADTISEETVYRHGLGAAVPVTESDVRRQAHRFLSSSGTPDRVTSWRLDGATGTRDGQSATVAITGVVEMPLGASLLAAIAGPVTVTVESTAQSRVRAAVDPRP